MSDPIRVRRFDGVTHIELHRPHRRNTIDLDLARELLRVALDPATRASGALLLTGAGGHFCAGGDLKSFQAQRDLPEHLLEVTAYLHAAMLRLRDLTRRWWSPPGATSPAQGSAWRVSGTSCSPRPNPPSGRVTRR